MSYLDRKAGNNQKALTAGFVALIQGGLALALLNGFAVTIFEREQPARLAADQIRLDPIPPEPVPEPTVLPKDPVKPEPVATARVAQMPLERDLKVDMTPVVTFPTGEPALDGNLVQPPVRPSQPPPRFAPRSARPGNDAAGWVTTEDYPTREIRAGHHGTVRFQLAIDARGRVSQCTVVASSGYPGLDQATCKYITMRARFEPATSGDGERVADTYSGTIRWVIPRD